MTTLGFFRRLYPSVREHREVEETTRRLLVATLPAPYVAPRVPRPALPRYLEKNAFSILFLALYRALGISRERRLFYGLVNHAVRGVVTATDNLLDDEYKEMLELRLPERAARFKSVLHILLFDRFLFRAVTDAQARGLFAAERGEEVHRGLFHALVAIGEEEAKEEGGVGEILTPRRILDTVHVHKGGNLLRLAFVVPGLVETEAAAPLEEAARGVYRIGLALQVIDDLTDFYDDLRERHHNYLVSTIHHEGSSAEREQLRTLLGNGNRERRPVQEVYPASVTRAMRRAIGEALGGFELLHGAGFWLGREGAMVFLRRLFWLRGAGALWALLPENDAPDVSLSEPAAKG